MSKRERTRLLPKQIFTHTAKSAEPDLFPDKLPLYIFKRKTTTETVNNSAAFQDDDDLFFTVSAGQIYELEIFLRYTTATAADFKWEISAPTGASFSGVTVRLGGSAAAVTDDATEFVTLTGVGVGGLGTGTHTATWIKGLLIIDEGGTVQLRWAQATANASDTILRADSYLSARLVE